MIEKIKLEDDERILTQVRKHWFVISVQLLSLTIVALLPLLAYLILREASSTFENINEYTAVLISLYTIWLLVMWMALFTVWTNYYLDVWTITTKRIIAVNQHGFFFRDTASFRLDRLQDTNISVNGIIATLLDFGSIEIHTAHEEKIFKAHNLPRPGELKSIILSATDKLLSQNDQNRRMEV